MKSLSKKNQLLYLAFVRNYILNTKYKFTGVQQDKSYFIDRNPYFSLG